MILVVIVNDPTAQAEQEVYKIDLMRPISLTP